MASCLEGFGRILSEHYYWVSDVAETYAHNAPLALGTTGVALVATFGALEMLRRRKLAVAAEDRAGPWDWLFGWFGKGAT